MGYSGVASLEANDAWVFGHDPKPGIVSVHADRYGQAIIWRRLEGKLIIEHERYRPWVYARHLHDFEQTRLEQYSFDDPNANIFVIDGAANSTLNPRDYRYLITARDGRNLEQTILRGATLRTGESASSLNDLPDYYTVGRVEQYLMQSGRTYFHGLHFADLRRLQFDLETSGFDAQHGRIFMVSVRDSTGFETVLEAPNDADEPAMIRVLMQLIRERDPDVIENHNLFGFDLPFLLARAEAHDIRLELGRNPGPLEPVRSAGGRRGREQRYSLAGRELLDTLDAVWRHDFVARDMPSHGLKAVAKYFGVASEDREYIPGHEIFKTYSSNPERVRRYALDDVREVDAISKRLHAPAFALTRMAPRRFERVASAGTATGILEPMLVRAYVQAGAALPCSSDPEFLEPHAGGGLHLFGTGVIKHVVKADVASLYPSLIRTYGIGPKCDALGVFVHVVDRLTALRLEHKQAAQELSANTDSLEHGEHHALQAAMKLVINSAYGYLGAGRMALLADRAAADEITRRGREILENACNELRSRGVTLIEADTDGVFFSVPKDWANEARERELVQSVASTLPAGLQLEFDGRSLAMFSHELKNYALLRYDGRLLVRGGALHSSRSESYGSRFLNQALRALLEGNIIQVRDVFLETIRSLRSRALPTSDVAMGVKLTKSPLQYRDSRRSEAMYEAMLASGFNDWRIGQRVRIYRATGNRWLVLKNDDEVQFDDPRDYDVEHYVRSLKDSYAQRLRKAFQSEDFEHLFRLEDQLGLFDRPADQIQSVFVAL
jgi:DNA polymerase, archaea type